MQKFEINCVHTTADDKLTKYVTRKIGHLDRYLSRHNQGSAHCEVKLKENNAKNKQQYTCEVTLHLPGSIINVSETTLNTYAAVDIVETKLKQQIKKYNELHSGGRLHRRLFMRFARKAAA